MGHWVNSTDSKQRLILPVPDGVASDSPRKGKAGYFGKQSCPAVLVLPGIEFIFLPVAAVFWIQYDKNVDNIDGFSYYYEIQDFFQSLTFS